MARAAKKRTKLSRDDWLASSMDALLLEGVEGIHIEPLAKRLGVTKGSFYWHFKDRQASPTRQTLDVPQIFLG